MNSNPIYHTIKKYKKRRAIYKEKHFYFKDCLYQVCYIVQILIGNKNPKENRNTLIGDVF